MAKQLDAEAVAARMASRLTKIPQQDAPRVYRISLKSLDRNPNQPRQVFDDVELQDLADSIQEEGLLFPILVCPKEGEDRYQLIAGERRCRAHELLGRTEIHALVTSPGKLSMRAIVENVQRVNLHPLDLAEALARLQESEGVSQSVLGRIIGKKRNTVNEILSLNRLAPQIKEECRTSDTSKSTLIEIAREPSEAAQLLLWNAIRTGGHATTVKEIRDRKGAPNQKSAANPLPSTIKAARSFARKLGKLPKDVVITTTEEAETLRELRERLNELLEAYASSMGRSDAAND